jgi:hypothetical protein
MDNFLIAKKDANNAVQLARHAKLQQNVLFVPKLDTQLTLKELAHLFAGMELLSLDKAAIQEISHLQVVLDVKFNKTGSALANLPLVDQLFQLLPQLLLTLLYHQLAL